MQTALDRLLLLHPAPWETTPPPGHPTILDGLGFPVGAWHDEAAGIVEAVLGIAAASAACDEQFSAPGGA